MKPHALVVDDDDGVRYTLAGILEDEGVTVTQAASGEAALAVLDDPATPEVHLVVTDMRMPGMSGLELHQRLAASGAPIPTILITAYATDATRSRARQAGIRCCLAKPFAPDELLECVREALARSKPKS